MKREINICLGIRWSNPDYEKTASATEYLLESLDNSFYKKNLPMHWLLPSSPFLECRHRELNNLLLEIRTRVKSLNDMPVATGYAGACLPLLTNEEMEKELSWAITNPWNSGIKDTFGILPEILIPDPAILWEKEKINLYLDNGFKYIGVNSIFPSVLGNANAGITNEITFFPYENLNSLLLWPELKKKVRQTLQKKYQTLFFIINICPGLEINVLKSMWQNFIKIPDWLAKQYPITFTHANKSISINQELIPDLFHKTFFLENSPGLRNRLLAIDEYKIQKEKKQEDYKNILMLLNLSYMPELNKNIKKRQQEIFPPADRASDCTMQGNTILAGSDFTGNFFNGKLYNLNDNHDRALLAGETAKSYIKINKKEYQFRNLSSFSVGGEYIRGLRESLTIELPGQIHAGFQITEYIFIDDFPYLLISSCIKYPVLDLKTEIAALAPFEIPLFFINKPLQIKALSPGSIREYTIDPVHDLYTIPANMVSIPRDNTNLVFGYPPGKNSIIGVMEFKIKKHKKQQLLVINLCGTYIPVEAKQYNKTTEIFSFYIGVSPVLPEKIPHFPTKILKEIPDQLILIE